MPVPTKRLTVGTSSSMPKATRSFPLPRRMVGASTKRRSTSLTKLPDVRAARRGRSRRSVSSGANALPLLMPRELLVRSATERPSAQAHTGPSNPITSQTSISAPLPALLAQTHKTNKTRVLRATRPL